MVSPFPPDRFVGAPFLAARIKLSENDAIAGFPAVSLVLYDKGGEPLAAAALIATTDRVTTSVNAETKVWASSEEQKHIWRSEGSGYTGGVPVVALRSLYVVLSATAIMYNVRPVARIGTFLSASAGGSFPAGDPQESPWGVCMRGRPVPHALWRYNVTFFVHLGISAVDDSTFALDKLSPPVAHAAQIVLELSETSSVTTRRQLLKHAASIRHLGESGVIGPTARMRMLLALSKDSSGFDSDEEGAQWIAPPRPKPLPRALPLWMRSRYGGGFDEYDEDDYDSSGSELPPEVRSSAAVRVPEVIEILSDSDEDKSLLGNAVVAAVNCSPSPVAPASGIVDQLFSTAVPTSARYTSVASVIDSLVPEVRKMYLGCSSCALFHVMFALERRL
jgi:hypothetical protein